MDETSTRETRTRGCRETRLGSRSSHGQRGNLKSPKKECESSNAWKGHPNGMASIFLHQQQFPPTTVSASSAVFHGMLLIHDRYPKQRRTTTNGQVYWQKLVNKRKIVQALFQPKGPKERQILAMVHQTLSKSPIHRSSAAVRAAMCIGELDSAIAKSAT